MFVERLIEVMNSHGLSARDLADKTGASLSAVYNYTRDREPPAAFIAEVCRKFDVSPRWLLLGEGTMTGEKDTTNIDRRLLEGSIAAVIEAGVGDLPADKVAKVVVIVYEAALSTGHVDKTSIPGLIELAR